ncbi:MAG: hypothetical protein ACYC5Q_14970 [Thermoleophilia bacterium]
MTSTIATFADDQLAKRPTVYLSSWQTTSRAADDRWGQPSATSLRFHQHNNVFIGTDRGVYVSSSGSITAPVLATLADELAGWDAASDAAFFASGLEL